MNAHALLSSQGWRGHGHSLHKNDDSIGLAKPLLLSRKDNTKGLGNPQHFNSDQWWLNAFDEQLKGLETNEKGQLVQTITTGKLNTLEKGTMGKYSVYTSFVKGGFLEGTVDLLEKQSTTSESDEAEVQSPAPPKTAAKPKATKETKDERRARKEAKRKRKEDRAQAREARRERKKLKAQGLTESESSKATKEEKKQRKARKEEKRRQRESEGKSKKT